jgi:hypothetical protein
VGEYNVSLVSSRLPESLFDEEELHEELAACVTTERDMLVLRHPLVYSVPYFPVLNKGLNIAFAQKIAALQSATEQGHWSVCVTLFERPYRVDAFCEYMHLMSDAQYWELLASVWIDSENIRENQQTWQNLLSSSRGDSHAFAGSVEELAAMPESFLIYQGHTDDRDDGWSWTIDEQIAAWFAHRYARLERASPAVSVAVVKREDVLAFRQDRGEQEIIVDPRAVVLQRVYEPGVTRR